MGRTCVLPVLGRAGGTYREPGSCRGQSHRDGCSLATVCRDYGFLSAGDVATGEQWRILPPGMSPAEALCVSPGDRGQGGGRSSRANTAKPVFDSLLSGQGALVGT